jgi:hypothetical protein
MEFPLRHGNVIHPKGVYQARYTLLWHGKFDTPEKGCIKPTNTVTKLTDSRWLKDCLGNVKNRTKHICRIMSCEIIGTYYYLWWHLLHKGAHWIPMNVIWMAHCSRNIYEEEGVCGNEWHFWTNLHGPQVQSEPKVLLVTNRSSQEVWLHMVPLRYHHHQRCSPC